MPQAGTSTNSKPALLVAHLELEFPQGRTYRRKTALLGISWPEWQNFARAVKDQTLQVGMRPRQICSNNAARSLPDIFNNLIAIIAIPTDKRGPPVEEARICLKIGDFSS
jgi:hypothetical protein